MNRARSVFAQAVVNVALLLTSFRAFGPGRCPDCRGTGVVALTTCDRCGGLGRRMSGQEGWPR